MFTQESISKVLREINANIPKHLKANAYTETSLTPTIEKVMAEAMLSDNISDEKKVEIKRLSEEGYFRRKKIRENPKYVIMIDNWVNRELKKAVTEGRLPTKKKLAELEIQWKKDKEEKKS